MASDKTGAVVALVMLIFATCDSCLLLDAYALSDLSLLDGAFGRPLLPVAANPTVAPAPATAPATAPASSPSVEPTSSSTQWTTASTLTWLQQHREASMATPPSTTHLLSFRPLLSP